MKKVSKIAGKPGNKLKEEIVEMYPELFKGLGRMDPEHHIKLNDNESPIVHLPKKIPIGLREKLKKELDSMDKTGVIRKADEPTEWVNSMVVVDKPNGELREIASKFSGANVFTKIDANKGY